MLVLICKASPTSLLTPPVNYASRLGAHAVGTDPPTMTIKLTHLWVDPIHLRRPQGLQYLLHTQLGAAHSFQVSLRHNTLHREGTEWRTQGSLSSSPTLPNLSEPLFYWAHHSVHSFLVHKSPAVPFVLNYSNGHIYQWELSNACSIKNACSLHACFIPSWFYGIKFLPKEHFTGIVLLCRQASVWLAS